LADTTQLLVKPKLALTYAGLVGVPLAALLVFLRWGQGVSVAPPLSGPPTNASPVPAVGFSELALLMGQIGLIILLSRGVGSLIERIRQPRVIGEVLAGLLLGPSFLGWVAPRASASLFPPQSFGVLNALSQVGLVLFMFLVGLELNVKEVHRQGREAILISHASIAAPMALGAMLALYLYPRLSDAAVSFTEFALFMGVAMSVTAFPVLARILSERKLLRSRLGTMAIACAAVGDVTGWCVLAYVVGLARATHSSLPLWKTIAGVVIFLVVMFGGVRLFLRKIERGYLAHGEISDNWKALLLLVLLSSALTTEALGLHLLFGAFIAGAVMPRNRDFASYIIDRFEPLTVLLLLPLFFAYTGLRTSIGQVKGLEMWGLFLLIIVAAIAGKLGGTSIAARAGGMPWRESLALGALMNTRGLMELIVLNIGLDIKVISPALFSMMVIMAIVTTMMTPPLLEWVYPATGQDLPSKSGQ
jgi:Kef-type K+ transport system membrane component KefB